MVAFSLLALELIYFQMRLRPLVDRLIEGLALNVLSPAPVCFGHTVLRRRWSRFQWSRREEVLPILPRTARVIADRRQSQAHAPGLCKLVQRGIAPGHPQVAPEKKPHGRCQEQQQRGRKQQCWLHVGQVGKKTRQRHRRRHPSRQQHPRSPQAPPLHHRLQRIDTDHAGHKRGGREREEPAEKGAKGAQAHAAPCPEAVMVSQEHTAIAICAVSTARGLWASAACAVSLRVQRRMWRKPQP